MQLKLRSGAASSGLAGARLGRGRVAIVVVIAGSALVAIIDSIKVKRLLLGFVITLTVRGSEFKLEANAAAGAKPMAEAFEQAKIEA